ncbi:MAG: hypothetical protein ABI761_09675 [Saprospiraceae bacterium]
MNRVIINFFVVFLSVYSRLFGQSSFNSILLTAWNDEPVKNKSSLVEYRKAHPQTLQWLDKIELRTQTNEFNFSQQEYGVRFYSNQPSDIRYRKQSESLEIDELQTEVDEVLHKALLLRYHLLTDLYLNELEKKMIQQQDSFYKRKINYLESLLLNQLNEEVKDLIQSTRKDDKLSARLVLLKEESEFFKLKVNDIGIKETSLPSFDSWILPDQIKQILNTENKTSEAHPVLQKFNQSTAKLNLEKTQIYSEKWDILNFIQARWRNNSKDFLFNEKVSLGAGFRIPYSGDYRKNKNTYQYEAFKSDLALKEWQFNYAMKAKVIKTELLQILSQIEQNQIHLKAFEKKFRNPELLQHPSLTVLDQLLIEETLLDGQEELFDLQKKLFRSYLEYLDHSRLISLPPYKNYLLNALPVIKE